MALIRPADHGWSGLSVGRVLGGLERPGLSMRQGFKLDCQDETAATNWCSTCARREKRVVPGNKWVITMVH
jgi:hypothetical protein